MSNFNKDLPVLPSLIGLSQYVHNNVFPANDNGYLVEKMQRIRSVTENLESFPNLIGIDKFRLTGSKMGIGLSCSEKIGKDDFVIEYCGEYEERVFHEIGDDAWHSLETPDGFIINATKRGNLARTINHGCNPNCHVKHYWFENKPIAILKAKRDILPGEELSYDYDFLKPHATKNKKCLCKYEKCRQRIAKRFGRPPPPTYPCPVCGKHFKSVSKRDEHHRVHSGEKPFKCVACERTFSHKRSKNRHTRSCESIKTLKMQKKCEESVS